MYDLPKELPVKPLPKLGKNLGNGSFKTAFASLEDPTKVYLCGNNPDEQRREIASLNKLEKLGVPVLPVHDVFQAENKYAFVIVADRCMIGSKAARWGLPNDAMNLLNDNTIRTGKAIIEAVRQHGIIIGDFQFLLAMDGSLLVADPQEVTTGYDPVGAVDGVSSSLESYIHGARLMKAIAAGKSTITPTGDTIFQLGKNFWRDQKKVLEAQEEEACAVMGIYTQKIRRVWKKQ